MWFNFAITFAALSSIGTVIAKKILKDSDEYAFILFSLIFIIPFLLLFILFFYKIPTIDSIFFKAVVISSLLDVCAMFFINRAIKNTDISLVNPIQAFNPVFTTIISYFTLRETIGIKGGFGILLVVLGAYLLQIKNLKNGILFPVRSLLKNKGVQYAFLAYFLWAITPTLQKIAISHTVPSVPPFVSLFGLIISMIIYIPITAKLSKNPFGILKKHFKAFLLFGLLGGVGQFAAFTAISLVNLGYATAAFREKDIKERILGSFVMLIGVILLVT